MLGAHYDNPMDDFDLSACSSSGAEEDEIGSPTNPSESVITDEQYEPEEEFDRKMVDYSDDMK